MLSSVTSAQLPKTEIWVFDLKASETGYSISHPIRVKMGNGYNNQPFFSQDGTSMYFVSNGKKNGKTDIYQYYFNRKRNKIKQLTDTKDEAEYSPMLTPDLTKISCIRVAKDTVTQNMCTYNLKGKHPTILFPEIKTFGYYCWKSQIDLLAFHVTKPFSFMKHNFPYNKHDRIYDNIGRCIVNNRGRILYVDKRDSSNWTIKLLNNKRLGNRQYEYIEPDKIISEVVPGAEDFAFIRSKHIVMAKDGFIYWKKNVMDHTSKNWQALFDLNHYKLYNVYRIAVSPVANKIAVVAYVNE